MPPFRQNPWSTARARRLTPGFVFWPQRAHATIRSRAHSPASACAAVAASSNLFSSRYDKTETGVRPGRRRIQLHHAREFGARFCESFRHRQVKGEKCSCLWVDRVQVDCFAIEFDCSIHVSACYLEVARGDHNVRICRRQRQCLAQRLSRRVPVKIEIGLDRSRGRATPPAS